MYLMQADLAGKDFTAEKQQVIVISTGNNKALTAKDQERNALQRRAAEQRHQHRYSYSYSQVNVQMLLLESNNDICKGDKLAALPLLEHRSVRCYSRGVDTCCIYLSDCLILV